MIISMKTLLAGALVGTVLVAAWLLIVIGPALSWDPDAIAWAVDVIVISTLETVFL